MLTGADRAGLTSARTTRDSTPGEASAYPMSPLVVDREKTTPTTWPSGSTRGPPELPGRTIAWIS